MKESAPNILPIFRSASQARILVELFVHAKGPISLAELARRTGGSSGSVHREVERLEEAGLLRSHRVGRTRLVGPDRDSPYHDELRSLLTKAFGPATILRRLLADVGGIGLAFVFGSWAETMSGDWSEQPADIDVMIVGNLDVERVHDCARQAERQLGRPVNTTILTMEEWQAAESGFLETVAAGPKIGLVP